MEGMVVPGCQEIQAGHMRMLSLRGSAHSWVGLLSMKLLECTHVVHDKDCGTLRSQHKEEILQEIGAQMASEDCLSTDDQYLLKINLGDMSSSSREAQKYWMLAIQAARCTKLLRDQLAEGIVQAG